MKDAEGQWRYALKTCEAPLSAETNFERILAAFETDMSFTETQCPEIVFIFLPFGPHKYTLILKGEKEKVNKVHSTVSKKQLKLTTLQCSIWQNLTQSTPSTTKN